MNIYYMSISGNTRAFVTNLQKYAQSQHEKNNANPPITLYAVDDNTLPEPITAPFFVFVPTYLEGGNGVDNGDQEILTEALREYIAYEDNQKNCLGIVGSGNKNFNRQYCLTAKQYAAQFNCPFLADYELRGTPKDVERIYQILLAAL
ncbi:nrdI protein [Enterococcus sp. DIV0755b]|uniref:class Ib ribonucleoside-diphosphate reductase assembly flavoprotein NrdI n=1 Tax=Enterococcus sp. DIV0755b TaxID=2774657 RepID=UPI003F28B2E5